jgi:hypothetical protein
MVWEFELSRDPEEGRGEPERGVKAAAMVRVSNVSLFAGSPQSGQKRLSSDSSRLHEAHFLIEIDHRTMKRVPVGDQKLSSLWCRCVEAAEPRCFADDVAVHCFQ